MFWGQDGQFLKQEKFAIEAVLNAAERLLKAFERSKMVRGSNHPKYDKNRISRHNQAAIATK